jgi:cation diffusion facilitator CzcD-associated flavoprotein CzcO
VHSSEYRDPRDLAEARVLVVGTGAASGSDIAQDACSLAQSVTGVGPDPPVDDPSRADAGKVYFYYHMGN